MSGFVSIKHVKFESLRPHIAKAAEVIKDYTAIFAFNDGALGSGTFVNIGGFTGILTAYHVAEYLERFADFSLVVADYPHRLEATTQTVHHVVVGSPPPQSAPETGPDLSFLVIRNPTLVEAIQSEKLFYNMDFAHSDPLSAPTTPKIWGVAGTFSDSFERIAEDYRGEPLSKLQNFVGTGDFRYETWKKDFDYIRLTVPAGESTFPWHYDGLSGGGFWLIPMEVDASSDLSTIGHRPPLLTGVQFAQSDPENRERVLTAHGFNSIGTKLRQALEAQPSSLYPLPS
jgi:hypothetical protein